MSIEYKKVKDAFETFQALGVTVGDSSRHSEGNSSDESSVVNVRRIDALEQKVKYLVEKAKQISE